VNKRAIYRLVIISLTHAQVHVTDFPVVNVHVDELSSARIWQHKLCATYSVSVNINNRLPIKIYRNMSTVDSYPIYSFKNTLSLLKYFLIFIKLMTLIRIFSVVFNRNNTINYFTNSCFQVLKQKNS
jgi:hypothetical protein